MLDRRFGRFVIDIDTINGSPEVVRHILGEVIVFEASTDYPRGVVDYQARCDAFEPVEAGATVPTYDILFDPETNIVSWSAAA